jgi:hypothetical protein
MLDEPLVVFGTSTAGCVTVAPNARLLIEVVDARVAAGREERVSDVADSALGPFRCREQEQRAWARSASGQKAREKLPGEQGQVDLKDPSAAQMFHGPARMTID